MADLGSGRITAACEPTGRIMVDMVGPNYLSCTSVRRLFVPRTPLRRIALVIAQNATLSEENYDEFVWGSMERTIDQSCALGFVG